MDEKQRQTIFAILDRNGPRSGRQLVKIVDAIRDGLPETGFESPIEFALFLPLFAALSLECAGPYSNLRDGHSFGESDVFGGMVEFRNQVMVGPYRTDFLITVTPDISVAVECDGHDFHEKTKEQAQRDKVRDRWFQTSGIFVLRFTGSEIWRDAADCAVEVHDAVLAACRRRRVLTR